MLRTFKAPNWTIVFGWRGRESWSLPLFMFVLSYGLILYLLSVILFPTDMPESWDPSEHLIRKRGWFFGVFIALIGVEVMDSYLKDHLSDFPLPYFLLLATWLPAGLIAWWTQKRRTHDIVALFVLLSDLAWVSYQLSDLQWSLLP